MTQREIVPPTTNEHGDEVHPAFVLTQVHRTSSTPGAVLFDSELRHQHTIRLTVSRATRKRDLNRDWIHGGHRQLIEVELSEAQWASLVSSVGNGSGTPTTLRWVAGEGQVPGLPYEPRLAHSMAEVKDATGRTFGKIKQALADYEQAVAEKAGAKVIRERLRNLHYAVENTEGNLTFVAESLSEHTENVVQKARADIEAMVVNKAAQLGLSAGDTAKVLELPVLSGEREAIES